MVSQSTDNHLMFTREGNMALRITLTSTYWHFMYPVPVDQWKKVAKRTLHPEKLPVSEYRSKQESQQIDARRRTLAEHSAPSTDSNQPETQTDKLIRRLQAPAKAKMK